MTCYEEKNALARVNVMELFNVEVLSDFRKENGNGKQIQITFQVLYSTFIFFYEWPHNKTY